MMINYMFKLVMLMLLVRNIRGRIRNCKGRGRHYFFVCYAVTYSVLLLLESMWQIPQPLYFVVLFTLYMGSLRRYHVSRRLFKTFLRMWEGVLGAAMVYKYPVLEVLCLGLMILIARLMGVFGYVRFELFRLRRFVETTLRHFSNRSKLFQ